MGTRISAEARWAKGLILDSPWAKPWDEGVKEEYAPVQRDLGPKDVIRASFTLHSAPGEGWSQRSESNGRPAHYE